MRGWSRSPKALPGIECFSGSDGLDAFLRGSRVVVCVLPLTADTSSILGRVNLARMPKGSYLINVARGGIWSKRICWNWCKIGHIAAATLDVFTQEPLPAQHPFWQEPRITLTPHMAALTLRDESALQIAEKIRALQRGEAVAGMVDRTKGY